MPSWIWWLAALVAVATAATVLIPSFYGGAWSPTPMRVVRRMIGLADLKGGETLYDLGAGDGRVVIHAAANHRAHAVGVELDPLKTAIIARRVRRRGLGSLVRVERDNFFTVDLARADVVFAYLSPVSIELLKAKFARELAPGARVVSYRRPIDGWTPWRRDGEIYVYRLPDSLPGPEDRKDAV